MADKRTSKKVASKASAELRDRKSTARDKSVAASDLTRAAPKKAPVPKKKGK